MLWTGTAKNMGDIWLAKIASSRHRAGMVQLVRDKASREGG